MNSLLKGIPVIVGILLCLCLLSPSLGQAQDFIIKDFHSAIVIMEDGTFTVTETIHVYFQRDKHGIYREIPYKYKDELGKTKKIPIDIISITDEKRNKLTTQVSKKGNVVNIRIGDADRYVSGSHTYVISYRVTNGILYYDEHDELYWNITGNYWKADIKKASAAVVINSSRQNQNPSFGCYTGYYGSSQSDCSHEAKVNGATFISTAELTAGEGLTIAYGFDKGIVAEPSDFDIFIMSLDISENWGFILPIISFWFMITSWNRKGRDPKVREAVTVMYSPPQVHGKELIPAEIGALIDETMDPRDISASIIGLAAKGFLKIEEIEDKILFIKRNDYRLTALKDDFRELTEFERELMISLFTGGISVTMVSELKNKFYQHLPKLKKAVFNQLVEYDYFDSNPQSIIVKYIGFGCIVLLAVGASQWLFSDSSSPVKPIAIALLTAIPFFIFCKWMPVKTRKGALALSDCLGFQEFLQRAEKDKLERMHDKDLFSKYLPYAIALNVVDLWAKAFEGIEQNNPTWYTGGPGITHFHPSAFASAISTATSDLSSAVFSAPRGSGTSGGGSSGGGGGGGGGGSW